MSALDVTGALPDGHAAGDHMLVPRTHVVIDTIPETPGVVTLRVRPVSGEPSTFEAAQVSMLGAFGIGEAAISISSSPSETEYHEYTIRRAGEITRALVALRAGDQLMVRGPFGRKWDLGTDEPATRDVLVVAGGIGLAPLRSAVHLLTEGRVAYRRAALVIGARVPMQLLYEREHEAWAASGLQVATTVDEARPGWSGRTGVVCDVFADLPLGWANTDVLMCGPDAMMRSAAHNLVDLGVDATRIQLTLERNMHCATGRCGHCQLGPVLICRDGPVVRYPLVAAAMEVPEL